MRPAEARSTQSRPVSVSAGFVNSDPEYTEVPKVIIDASDLIHELFGEAGAHARTASVATLPQGAAVMVDAIFGVR